MGEGEDLQIRVSWLDLLEEVAITCAKESGRGYVFLFFFRCKGEGG